MVGMTVYIVFCMRMWSVKLFISKACDYLWRKNYKQISQAITSNSKHVESPAMSNNKHTNEIENGKLK